MRCAASIALFLLAAALRALAQPAPRDLPKELLSDVWQDQKTIWTAPFHLNRDESFEWLGFTALTATLVLTDRGTSKIFENSAGQVAAGNAASRLGETYTLIPEAAGLYLFGVLADNQKARETGFLGGEALVDAFVVVEALKTAAGRNRPNAASKAGDFFQGGASFPSGHAIASWALASVVAREYGNHKWVPWVAYGVAGVVGGARFAARQHYASDVVAGSAMGFFIGKMVVDKHKGHPAIQPIAQPSTRTYGLQLSM
jgi:membrane-associated phospholipid phosphatase